MPAWALRAALRLSPSLRGSGLKCNLVASFSCGGGVSLFTGERIEILSSFHSHFLQKSPSLRGSGLKFGGIAAVICWAGLPLYGGAD